MECDRVREIVKVYVGVEVVVPVSIPDNVREYKTEVNFRCRHEV